MEDNAEIFFFQGDALEPAGDSVDGGESRPHTPGHGTELLPVAGVALADDLVKIRCPQNVIFVGELGQPPLGDLKSSRLVENIQ